MKITKLILSILFALFALAQYNDPDSLIWILVYLFVAIVSFLAFKGIYNRILLIVAISILLIWLGFLFPGFINWLQEGMPTIVDEMKTTKPHIEIVREFLGLFLAILALGFHFVQAGKSHSPTKE